MTGDQTFITNEEGQSLVKRFTELISGTRFFDCLVGYFYASGFYMLYKSLETTEKIRILIGISTSKDTYDLIQKAKEPIQLTLNMSHKETKEEFSKLVVSEMENSKDEYDVEEGIRKFIEWIRTDKLEIKVYPSETIHAKLYIMSFKEGHWDKGRVITGSSNFTRSGLRDNIEFNVELKNRSDFDFALTKFNELWEHSIDVSEKYIETINQKTWLNDEITPYELFLKFLFEYLKEKINIDKDELYQHYFPENFMDLEYQKDAVRDAKVKLDEYGGVFISDVVGLGKTYISAMLANELDGRSIVIAPPRTIDKDNPGSWPNVFSDLGVRQTDFESIGQLDKLRRRGVEKYTNIIIDEAHRFRTETTQMYEQLFDICRGKRVILVSATPLNNTPLDILSQIKLFQNAHRSTLPNPKVRDLEYYFKSLQNRLKGLDRIINRDEYLQIVKENAENIRRNVLRYLMIRRTRTSIINYYKKDLETQGLKFPKIKDPQPIVYHFDEKLDKIFNKTLTLLISEFKYARYTPLLYLMEDLDQLEEASQKNMGRFMKILLLKRLESSNFAFKQSITRFIHSYKRFIEIFEKGRVFTSKKHMSKIFDLLENDDEDAIQRLIEEEKAEEYAATKFSIDLIEDLKHDLRMLEEIDYMWKGVKQDPKLETFIEHLSDNKILSKNKIIVFTESRETAEYLERELKNKFGEEVISFSSMSSEPIRTKIIENFDANYRKDKQKDDLRILISTDVLSEGVNLHRSNVVINYDIPWNPVRMMQRVGRVNRVSKKPPFDTIHTFNFFPAGPINENIGLKEAAESKIQAFIEMLGNDAPLLTEEEIKSHDLFIKLTSKETITGEDEEDDPELKYLIMLRDIRDNNVKLYERIKRVPKKARCARLFNGKHNSVFTFFRKGKLRKMYLNNHQDINELDFVESAELLAVEANIKREKIGRDFYEYLEQNKERFEAVFSSDQEVSPTHGTRSSEAKLKKIIKAIQKKPEFTDVDEDYLQEIMNLINIGGIAKATLKKVYKEVKDETDPLKILARIKSRISPNVFQGTFSKTAANILGPREIILSEYLIKEDGK